MNPRRRGVRGAWKAAAVLVAGALFQFGFLNGCNDRLNSLTDYFDPCGTIFANCAPGQLQANRAPLGDFCIDPTCTIPGGCQDDVENLTQPIGTFRNLCD